MSSRQHPSREITQPDGDSDTITDDDTDMMARLASQYTHKEVKTDYPSASPTETSTSSFVSISKTIAQNIRADLSRVRQHITSTVHDVTHLKETLHSSGATAVVTRIEPSPPILDGEDLFEHAEKIHHIKLHLDNGTIKTLNWKFDADHSTYLQRFIEFYTNGTITQLKGAHVFLNDNGELILPKKSGLWFGLTNYLRPFNLTHQVMFHGYNSETRTRSDESAPHYDFSMRAYGNLSALMLLFSVSVLIHVASINVVLLLPTYIGLHLLAMPMARKSGNDPASYARFPWFFGVLFLILTPLTHIVSLAGYLITLPKKRDEMEYRHFFR